MTPPSRSAGPRPEPRQYLADAIGLISKKWHPDIVSVLLDAGPQGFSDLQTRLEPVSAKVLTDALVSLQEGGLVDRRVLTEHPLRVEYSLTPAGEALEPAIRSLTDWSERHLAADAGPPTVLVVDDDRRIADLHAEWLSREYEVRIAEGGDGALEQLDDDVDVIVLDRRMPGLSGDRLAKWARRERPDRGVVVLTSMAPDTDLVEVPFDEYLTKPTRRADLLAVVEAVLARREHDSDVREYLRLRTKEALLREQLPSEQLDGNDAYVRLQTRIEELAATVESIPHEAVYRAVTEVSM
jgi:DNA-binding HxlR family transcriptional regulator